MAELITYFEDGKYIVFSNVYHDIIFEGNKEELDRFIDNYFDELLEI